MVRVEETMTVTTMMQWMLWLSVIGSNLRLVTPGNETATAKGVAPSSERRVVDTRTEFVKNYTELFDVTTQSYDVSTNKASQDGAAADVTVPVATEQIDFHIRNETRFENSSTDAATVKDEQTGNDFGGLSQHSNTTENQTSIKQTNETVTVKRVETVTSTTHALDTIEPTTYAYEEPLSAGFKSTSLSTPTSVIETPTSKTLTEPERALNLHTNVSTTNASESKIYEDASTPVAVISGTNLDTSGTHLNATTNITSSSSVPEDQILTTPRSSEVTRPSETSSTGFTPDFEGTRERKVSGTIAKNELETTLAPAAQQTAVAAGVTTPVTALTTNPVTGEPSTKDDDGDDDGVVVVEGDGSHEETAYERSLRTRRVINHAALWITIGFVVVLVSYITVLVIYNRTRPDWQDPQRPYSRFENEPEDFPEMNENNMDCENQELIQEFPPDENRRDFSQCVDLRDFPPCEGSNEYLLYEDPTYLESDKCQDFTYRDQC